MNRKLPWWSFAAAFLLQAALLCWMVADRAILLASGTEVRLAVVPIDPRDLLRGDYVVLAYDISQIDPATLEGDKDFAYGEPIYVSLRQDGDHWSATAIHHDDPGGEIVLRGKIVGTSAAGSGCIQPCRTYRVEYGLEKFFVPEGEGLALEEMRNARRISVDVAVGSGGRGALKRLLVDGAVQYEDSLL